MTSLSNLRTQLSQDFTRDPKNHVFPLPSVDRALNKAYERLQTSLQFWLRDSEAEHTATSVAGTMYYALPSDFMRVGLVRFDGYVLYKSTIEDLKAKYSTFSSDTGTPVAYFLYGDNIGLYPIPDRGATIDMQYSKMLPTITTSQDTTTSSAVDDCLCAYASYLLFRPIDKPRSVSFLQDANEALNIVTLNRVYDDDNISFSHWPKRTVVAEDALSYSE